MKSHTRDLYKNIEKSIELGYNHAKFLRPSLCGSKISDGGPEGNKGTKEHVGNKIKKALIFKAKRNH